LQISGNEQLAQKLLGCLGIQRSQQAHAAHSLHSGQQVHGSAPVAA
jgi:hypothetical protein